MVETNINGTIPDIKPLGEVEWTCPSCYRVGVPEVVPIRRTREEGWIGSTIRACPNCKYTFGGTLADRITHINCVYGYKYFGDYELSDEQKNAVGEMIAIANRVPKLIAALLEIAVLGEQGMRPDYGDWLTFHDNVAHIARSAISGQDGKS